MKFLFRFIILAFLIIIHHQEINAQGCIAVRHMSCATGTVKMCIRDRSGTLITRKTNIGNSRTGGIEVFLQKDFYPSQKTVISFFTASSWMSAYYESAQVRLGTENVDISGNRVESTPSWISRVGGTIKFLKLSGSALWSYTSVSFADAVNSRTPNSTGSTGLVPAYTLLDLSGSVRLNHQYKTTFNVNNVFNKHYFTKRPQFYPGPGIWPSDGRTFSVIFSILI